MWEVLNDGPDLFWRRCAGGGRLAEVLAIAFFQDFYCNAALDVEIIYTPQCFRACIMVKTTFFSSPEHCHGIEMLWTDSTWSSWIEIHWCLDDSGLLQINCCIRQFPEWIVHWRWPWWIRIMMCWTVTSSLLPQGVPLASSIRVVTAT